MQPPPPGELLVGKTAYVNEQKITGTMADNGAVSQNLNAGGSYTIPAGYHNGQGKVNANSLASQTSGTAAAVDIASGKTAYVNGEKITGEGEMARDLASEISTQDDLITQINSALANKVGKELPVLSNPAGAGNIEAGYQAIDGSGNLLVGSMVKQEVLTGQVKGTGAQGVDIPAFVGKKNLVLYVNGSVTSKDHLDYLVYLNDSIAKAWGYNYGDVANTMTITPSTGTVYSSSLYGRIYNYTYNYITW